VQAGCRRTRARAAPRLTRAGVGSLQGGRFDAPDRLFCSMREAWESATTGPADVKELIPEFFLADPRCGAPRRRTSPNPILERSLSALLSRGPAAGLSPVPASPRLPRPRHALPAPAPPCMQMLRAD